MSRLKHGRRASRRFLMLFAATAVALVVSLAGTHATTQATSGGSAYSIPLVGNMGDPDVTAVDTNPAANVVETTFVAEDATVDLGQGITAHALTFNGTIPGPTLKLNVGDTVIVRLVNNSSEATGIHWHGIELENSVDGTPFTQNQACSGCTYLYKFQVTRPGIYWYHPHHHSSTNQVFKGLYGMIIVTDPNEAALLPTGAHPTLPPLSATLPIVLSDITVCKAPGAWAPAEPTYPPNQPWVQNTNGGTTPTNLVQAGPTPRDLCKDTPIDKDGNSILPATWQNHDIPNIQKNGGGFEREGNVVLTNGRNVGGRGGYPQAPGAVSGTAELYNVQSGQGLRLQLVNASAIRFMRLRLTTAAGALVNLVRVGGEGGLLDHAVVEGVAPGGFDTSINAGEILLPPGSRADVVAAIPAGLPVSSVLTLWTEDTNRTGMGFSNLPTVPVMHLNVTGPAGSPYTIAQGTQLREATGDLVPVLSGSAGFLNPNSFVPLKPLDPGPPPPAPWSFSNDIHLTAAGFLAGIDTIFGTHDLAGDYASAFHLASSRFARMGNTLDLSVTNTTNAHHPFHLHGFSMQPTSLTKASSPTFTWPYHEFRDNIDIPSGYTLHFKVKLEDRPLEDGVTMGGALGRWVFHCHIFFHATLGMLGEMVVLPTTGSASNGNEKPTVNTAGTWEFAAAGDIAERHGTYHDVDGDNVTLTKSVPFGTLVKDPGGNVGTWQWTYDTTGQPDSTQYIYITATDANGNKDETMFRLKIGGLDDGSDNGDPHIQTVNNKNYDFQPAGEFTLLRDADGLEIQARQTPVTTATPISNTYTGLTSCVSINTAVAARLGSHHVSYQPAPGGKNTLQLYLDGKVQELGRAGGFDFGGGYRVVQYPIVSGSKAVEIDYPDKTVLTVTPWFWSANNVWLLQVGISHTPADEGVMGNTTSGWLPALANGASLGPRPVSLHDRYVDLDKTFADSWRVTDASSLFTYYAGQSTSTFTLPSWPPESGSCVVPKGFGQPWHPTGFDIKEAEAARLCEPIVVADLHDDCVFDIQVQDDPAVVNNFKQQQALRLNGTTVRVVGDTDSSQAGLPVKFIATVAPQTVNRPTPTGTVKFVVDGVATGPPVAIGSTGRAAWTTAALTLGGHTVSARYTPAAGSSYLASTSPNVAHTVTKGVKGPPITTVSVLGPGGLNGWYTGPVKIQLQVYTGQAPPSQGDTIRYRLDGGPWTIYRETFPISKDGRHELEVSTTSADGSVEKPHIQPVNIDSVPPEIAIELPADGSVVLARSTERSKYSCSDSLATIDFCKGPVASGDDFDTKTPGRQTFKVEAADQAGNAAFALNAYTVVYRFIDWTDPITPTGKGLNQVDPGDLIKVGFNLGGDYGLNILAGDFPLSTPIHCPDAVSHQVPAAGKGAEPGLSYTGHYVYGWQTSLEWAGTCRQFVIKLNDDSGQTYTADFRFTGRSVG